MASGRQSKRRRAAQPPAVQTKGTARKRQASPRVLTAAGALVVVAVVAVVLVAVLGGGGAKTVTVPARGTLTDALPGAADVHRQLNGIAQARNVLGRPSAPATLIEYVDLQCPYCAEFERQVMPQVITRYVRTGKLKIVARPIAFIGEDSRRGQAAVLAAARQNRMFDLMQLLYLHQGAENTGWLDENLLRQAAASVPGVEVQRLLDGRGASGSEAKRMESLAVSDSVQGTPTILVGKTAGSAAEVPLSGPDDAASVTSAIERTLAS